MPPHSLRSSHHRCSARVHASANSERPYQVANQHCLPLHGVCFPLHHHPGQRASSHKHRTSQSSTPSSGPEDEPFRHEVHECNDESPHAHLIDHRIANVVRGVKTYDAGDRGPSPKCPSAEGCHGARLFFSSPGVDGCRRASINFPCSFHRDV